MTGDVDATKPGTELPDEAVWKLAEHLYRVKYAKARTAMTSWEGLAPHSREYELNGARHALAAALPLLAEHWATRIESMIPAGAPMSDYMHGMKDAAYLVRGLGGDT